MSFSVEDTVPYSALIRNLNVPVGGVDVGTLKFAVEDPVTDTSKLLPLYETLTL
jgi:hypothetical protein